MSISNCTLSCNVFELQKPYFLLLIDSQLSVLLQLRGDPSTMAGGLIPCTNPAMETDCIGATSAVRRPSAGRRMETQSNMPSRLRSIGTAGMARDTDTGGPARLLRYIYLQTFQG